MNWKKPRTGRNQRMNFFYSVDSDHIFCGWDTELSYIGYRGGSKWMPIQWSELTLWRRYGLEIRPVSFSNKEDEQQCVDKRFG
ncbi:hypothetical protein CEXT_599981 [Caerostris extrusa]|uniref:Uncharacterized protein n=1 Tax=Caerostris extrusa TaxID=172846 RepID=A0AAV4RJA8_CAEEX|nr:hypothetical protein CEXT_599981 [Caerostris extrusa]